MKALPVCSFVEQFPPGHYAAYDLKNLTRIGFEAYHTIPWIKDATTSEYHTRVRNALVDAVRKRVLNTERPIAALLSGGLDSSLVAALVQKQLKSMGKPPLKTFSIGFKGSEDLRHARLVANHIGSDHTEVVMTAEDFFDAIPEVIQAIESFDITTVRASVGNYLVSKYIAQNTDCKVVFNGDGSDEVFGGYLYFKKAPSDEVFEYECRRLLGEIHYFDVLRSDRSNGLEARTPFLDKQFVSVALSLPTSVRRPREGVCEKHILRRAFESEVLNDSLLPKAVLWRRKEAFSDGVSGTGEGAKSWYEECQERALAEVGDDWVKKAARFTHLTPTTAEGYYYRFLFETYYKHGESAVVPHYWMPQWTNATDPSARTLDVYT
jgi:asparagine synthase (glutamine-hydrolysing)